MPNLRKRAPEDPNDDSNMSFGDIAEEVESIDSGIRRSKRSLELRKLQTGAMNDFNPNMSTRERKKLQRKTAKESESAE